jgi:diguanylate cyclase (GGDEF)-like protein/PAS domain S-box-containing protein
MSSNLWAGVALLTIGIANTLFVVTISWFRINTPGARTFGHLLLAITIWTFFSIFELNAVTYEAKLLFGRMQYIGIVAIPPLWLSFMLEYTHQTSWIAGVKRYFLWIIPVFTLILVFASDFTGLQWSQISLISTGEVSYLHYSHGPWFWVWTIYSYILIILGTTVILFAIFEFPRIYRRQAIFLLISAIIPLFVNFLYIVRVTDVDMTAFSFAASGLLITFTLLRFKLLTIVPVARGMLVENMDDGVLVLDEQNHIVDINPAAKNYLEVTEAQVIGEKTTAVLGKIDNAVWEHAGTDEATFEIKLAASGGKTRYFDLRISTIRGEKGELFGKIVVFRESTERRQTENALRDSEALYYSLVDNMYVAVFMKNIDGTYKYINRMYSDLNGVAPYDILGKTDFDLHPAEKAEYFKKTDDDVIKTGLSYEADEMLYLPVGGIMQVHIVKFPVRDREGKIIGLQGVFWDITKPRQNEEALRRQAEQLSTLNRAMQALSSTLNLRDVLDAILSELRKVVPYDSSSVLEIKGDYLEIIGGHGFSNLDELLGIRFGVNDESSPSTIVMRQGIPHILADAPVKYPAFNQGRHAAARIRGWMGVPLIFGNNRIGMITLDKHEVGFYNEEHSRLAMTFAAQAAIAIQNARLYEREHLHLQSQSLLFRLSASLAAIIREEQIWQELARGLYNQDLGYIHIVTLEFDKENDQRIVRSAVGWTEEQLFISLPHGKGVTEYAILDGQAHYFRDVSLEPDYVPGLAIGCEADVPIKIGEEVVGVLSLQSDKVNSFNQEDLDVFVSAANQAGMALGKARLLEESQQRYTEIASLQDQLREQAIRDSLTGLYNRRYLDETLEREIVRAKRDNQSVSLVIMDLDHFKLVNDTYGHKTGDKILQMLSGFLQSQSRSSDVICRFGGEEFIVVLPNTSLETAAHRADQWRLAFQGLFIEHRGRKIHTTISLGVAVYPDHGLQGEDILVKADTALYVAKQSGRNQVIIYDEKQPFFKAHSQHMDTDKL